MNYASAIGDAVPAIRLNKKIAGALGTVFFVAAAASPPTDPPVFSTTVPTCDLRVINIAVEHYVMPDFRHCAIDQAQSIAERFPGGLQIEQKDRPDERAALGTVVAQHPAAGSSVPEVPRVTLFVSTGPRAAPVNVVLNPAAAVAGEPLRFNMRIESASESHGLTYYTEGGTARPNVDYTPIRTSFSSASPPPSIIVPTNPNDDVQGDLSVGVFVADGNRILAKATGTISQPTMPPPRGTITDPGYGSVPLAWWEELVNWLLELTPVLLVGMATGVGAAFVGWIRPEVDDSKEKYPWDSNESEPSQVSANYEFAATTVRSLPRALIPSAQQPKRPVISLAVETSHGPTRIVVR